MFIRLLALSYVPLFFLSTGIAGLTDRMMLRGLVLIPAGVYVVGRFLTLALARAQGQAVQIVGRGFACVVIGYTALYSILYFPRAFSGAMALGSLPALVVHGMFWQYLYRAEPYRGRAWLFFHDLWLGILFGFLIGFGNALIFSGLSLQAGAIHDLDRVSAFVRSDLDVPLLATGLAIWGLAGTIMVRKADAGTTVVRGTALRWLALSMGLLALVMYSRRAPLIALLAAVTLMLLPRRISTRLYYVALLAPLVPFAWDVAVAILIPLTQNPVAEAVIARNDLSTYLTASNRLATWLRSIAFMVDLQWSHVLGYGDVPAHLLPRHLNWLHVHNAFLQLFFEAGFVTVAVALLILLGTFRRMRWLLLSRGQSSHVQPLFAFLWAWAVIAAVEPSFRSYTLVHMLFIMIALAVANLYQDERRRDTNGGLRSAPMPRGEHHDVYDSPRGVDAS